jgi:hypothetical protein
VAIHQQQFLGCRTWSISRPSRMTRGLACLYTIAVHQSASAQCDWYREASKVRKRDAVMMPSTFVLTLLDSASCQERRTYLPKILTGPRRLNSGLRQSKVFGLSIVPCLQSPSADSSVELVSIPCPIGTFVYGSIFDRDLLWRHLADVVPGLENS